jgi:hypothetical protein
MLEVLLERSQILAKNDRLKILYQSIALEQTLDIWILKFVDKMMLVVIQIAPLAMGGHWNWNDDLGVELHFLLVEFYFSIS